MMRMFFFVNIILNIYINLFNIKNMEVFLFYHENEITYKKFLLDNIEVIVNQIKSMMNKVKNDMSVCIIHFLNLILFILIYLNDLARKNKKKGQMNHIKSNPYNDIKSNVCILKWDIFTSS